MDAAYMACMQDGERELMKAKGFVPNAKRGTAFLIGKKAIDAFCDRNSLDFILRGHEAFPEGIRFFIGGQVVSVFSTSNYVGMNNSASALFLKGRQIRVIRIENDVTDYSALSP